MFLNFKISLNLKSMNLFLITLLNFLYGLLTSEMFAAKTLNNTIMYARRSSNVSPIEMRLTKGKPFVFTR